MAGEEEREVEAAPGPWRRPEPGDSPNTRSLALAHRWGGGGLRLPQAGAWRLSKHPKFGACS